MINPIKLFLISIAFQKVTSESCVTYNFESNFIELFSSEVGMCVTNVQATGEWYWGNYSSTSVEPPHPASTLFISPSSDMSCTSSYTFPMSSGGTFELHVYMDASVMTDQLLLFINEVIEGGDDTQVGQQQLMPVLPNYENGWHTLVVSLTSTGTFQGYVTLLASAAEQSTILVDAFRYIPPLFDDNDANEGCVIYTELESEEDENNSDETGENDSSEIEDISENISNESEEDDSGDPDEPNQTNEDISNETDETVETETSEENVSNNTDESNQTNENISNETNETVESDSSEMSESEEIDDSEENDSNDTDEPNQTNEDISNETNEDSEENGSNYTDESNQTNEDISNDTDETVESDSSETGESEEIDDSEENESNDTDEANQTNEDISNETDETVESDSSETNETDDSEEDSNTTINPVTLTSPTLPGNGGEYTESTTLGINPETTISPPVDITDEPILVTEPNDSTEENSTEDNITEQPEVQPINDNSFWNPFTIAMVVILSLIVLAVISLCCYECGKRRAQDKLPLIYSYNDIELPSSMIVPRVTRAYPNARVMSFDD